MTILYYQFTLFSYSISPHWMHRNIGKERRWRRSRGCHSLDLISGLNSRRCWEGCCLIWLPLMVYRWLWVLSGGRGVQKICDFPWTYLGESFSSTKEAAWLVFCIINCLSSFSANTSQTSPPTKWEELHPAILYCLEWARHGFQPNHRAVRGGEINKTVLSLSISSYVFSKALVPVTACWLVSVSRRQSKWSGSRWILMAKFRSS